MARKRRRRRRKQMKLTQWFKKLSKKQKILLIAGVVVLCLLIAGVIYVASLFGKLDTQKIKEEDIFVNEELDETIGEGYTNFVLFGGDSRSGEVDRYLNTDTIIIVSLNNETREVKLVSVYRDTLLDLSNGTIRKCNSAYSSGGAKRAINMLNMNLDLDIKKYVTVDFGAVTELVDMLGGVEVDVSAAERKAMNKYILETARVAKKEGKAITKTGLQTLDGVQATTYARIRKGVGDDYARTERQREVIQLVVEKAIKSDLSTITNIVNKLFPRISTNFTMPEILSYAKGFAKYKITETTGFPFKKGSGTIPGKGSSVFPITLESNVSELHEFLYGTEDYQPSSKVVSISKEIAYIVGNRKPDQDTTWTDPGTDTPDPENPNEDDPNVDDPNVDDPNVDAPNADDPNVDDPNVDAPNVDDPNVDDPNVDDPNVDDPNVDDPNVDDPNVDDPNVDDPNVDDPNVDDPNVDDPTTPTTPTNPDNPTTPTTPTDPTTPTTPTNPTTP